MITAIEIINIVQTRSITGLCITDSRQLSNEARMTAITKQETQITQCNKSPFTAATPHTSTPAEAPIFT